jgi:hypothetical protein
VSVFESIERHPVEYLKTGDRGLLLAWTTTLRKDYASGVSREEIGAVLCLEDGSCVIAEVDHFKFDYRYSNRDQRWYDVSRITEEEPDADPDQGDADDGSEAVPGLVPEPD